MKNLKIDVNPGTVSPDEFLEYLRGLTDDELLALRARMVDASMTILAMASCVAEIGRERQPFDLASIPTEKLAVC